MKEPIKQRELLKSVKIVLLKKQEYNDMKKTEPRNKLIMKYPAGWHGEMWREAIPVGNGKIGGLIYGGVYKEIIAINDGRLWTDINTPEMPDVSYMLPKMRELLLQNKPIEAETLYKDEFDKLGYKPTVANPLPLCDIEIIQSNEKGFKKYSGALDMEKAETEVRWTDGDAQYSRKFFVSREDDSAYLLMTVENGEIDAELKIKIHDEETLNGAQPPQNAECTAENNFLFFSAEKDGKDFGAVMKIKHNGIMHSRDGRLHISKATRIEACAKFFIYGERKEEFCRLKKEFDEHYSDFDYDKALEIHKEKHYPLFSATTIKLADDKRVYTNKSNEELLLDAYSGEASVELIEKLWAFGRYLLICASDEKGLPCHLYGLWTGGYNVLWAFNMFNVNIEMMYWQALPGGMPEMLLSIFNYLDEKMEDFRENARKLYGCRGINIPSVSTPESGLYKCLYPHILHWTGAAAWIAQFYYDYYLYTRDIEFLRKRAIPFMYETALFYEDFLFLNNGEYMFAPSNSPENTPKNIFEKVGRSCEVTVNATMDIALVKELLGNLTEACKITGEHIDSIEKWNDILNKLPKYTINEDGAIKEWNHPFYCDNYEHRHLSHIYPVFPGREIKKDDKLYPAFKRAVELRETVGLKDQSGWSLAYMANIYARMGEGEKALNCLDYLTRSVLLPNFFTVHNDWRRMGIAVCGDLRKAPIQLDAIMGLTAAVNEMFVFSTDDEIYLFNALPSRFKQGNIGPIYTRTGSRVSLKWNESDAWVRVEQCSSGGKIKLILPSEMKFELTKRNVCETEIGLNEYKEYKILTER